MRFFFTQLTTVNSPLSMPTQLSSGNSGLCFGQSPLLLPYYARSEEFPLFTSKVMFVQLFFSKSITATTI